MARCWAFRVKVTGTRIRPIEIRDEKVWILIGRRVTVVGAIAARLVKFLICLERGGYRECTLNRRLRAECWLLGGCGDAGVVFKFLIAKSEKEISIQR